MAQIGHRKLADAVEVVDITAGGEAAVVGLHRLFGQKVVGDVLDVVAVVGGFGPGSVAGLDALGTQLGAGGQRADLHTRVVVIELAVHRPALGGEEVADRVAERRLAAVAHMQRTGRVGRHELHHQALAVGRLFAKTGAGAQHLAHDLLLGRRLQADVDEARPGDVNVGHPLLVHGLRQQSGFEAFGHLARVELQGLGQLHGGGDGPVTVRGHFGRFKSSAGASAGLKRVEGAGQTGQQVLFDVEHGRDFRWAPKRGLRTTAVRGVSQAFTNDDFGIRHLG